MSAIGYVAVIVRAVLALAVLLSLVPFTVWLERKGAAFIQDRPGPNRAALFGTFRLAGMAHVLADVVKLLTKEDIIPTEVYGAYYRLAPMIAAMVPLMTFAIVPLADDFSIGSFSTPLSVLRVPGGLLWFFAITSLAVYGVVFAGWASASKYSLLGGLRSTAQLISYEVSMALAVIGTILVFGTVQPNDIVRAQGQLLFGWLPQWGFVVQPVACILFLVAAFAEINRVPFDLAEGEAELVAGYHTEYSGMRFGLFFMAEYMALVTSGAIAITLFFGGWQIPWLPTSALIAGVGIGLPVLFLLGAVGLAGAGHWMWGWYRFYRQRGDWRAKEPRILATGAVLGAVVLLGLAGLTFVDRADLPLWVAPVFALVAQLSAFVIKLLVFCWVFVWVRWTLPRFRYDQLMNLGWKGLLPVALLNLLVTAAIAVPMGVLSWVALGVAAAILVAWYLATRQAPPARLRGAQSGS